VSDPDLWKEFGLYVALATIVYLTLVLIDQFVFSIHLESWIG
jgi:hypothetical protein